MAESIYSYNAEGQLFDLNETVNGNAFVDYAEGYNSAGGLNTLATTEGTSSGTSESYGYNAALARLHVRR